ncbi:hypothetical protein [Olivibacter domesticus]|uniref:Four helix bundle sensory module for signal transduction n=1 Tax=Olivibacter domesticus TaxID=407022 RepID=A0A1H7X0A9_OLID1|nr:hypothetical protein [Olivibacter domesticus]SEM26518.1 hypothetical protein SAMN05661044_04725 [Olivibacter domesticus]
MKYIPLTAIIIMLSISGIFASSKEDSTAYEKQRERVNKLLDQRRERFGEFDASLTARSGIFGLKTKKDMQSSIDILKQIVLTDNNIFKETKALLDYKDFEKQTVEGQVEVSGERITGYINTISKLQRSQDQLAEEIMVLEKRSNIYLSLLLFAFLALMTSLYILTKRRKN